MQAGRLLPVADRILFRPLRTSLPLKVEGRVVEWCEGA